MLRGQFEEVIALNEAMFQACEAASIDCPPNARQVFDQIVSNAAARGIELPVISRWMGSFASVSGLGTLLEALAAESADPGGDWIESFLAAEGDDGGDVPFASVSCTDDPFEPPTLEQIDGIAAAFAQADPILSIPYAVYATLCTGWPTTRDPVPLPTARDASPLLVIGGTADSRTPYPWAQAMTETLGNATLLTSNHFGHGALTSGSDCVLGYVRAYLTSGSMPAAGATCP
jgi:pimeloyl-ACP methyl ester carboxylesterase